MEKFEAGDFKIPGIASHFLGVSIPVLLYSYYITETFALLLYLFILTFPIFFIFAIMMMNNSVFIYINSFYPLPDSFRIGNIIRLIFLPSSKRRVWPGSRSHWQNSKFLWCLRTCAPLLHSGLGEPPLGLHSSHAPKPVMQCCHQFTCRFPPPVHH